MELCEKQLLRATRLIQGLGTEKVSWNKKLDELHIDLKMMIGDILLCAGIITYLGIFTFQMRSDCVMNWQHLLDKFQIEFNPKCSLSVIILWE